MVKHFSKNRRKYNFKLHITNKDSKFVFKKINNKMIDYKIYNINNSVILHSKLVTDFFFNKNENILNKIDYDLFKQIKNQRRKQEFLTTRILINEYFKKQVYLFYLNRKPKLSSNSFISISHKNQELILCINENKEIGIDIEKIDAKIMKIQSKFCLEIELNQIINFEKTEYLTMLWSAKEATYKCLENQNDIFLTDIYVKIINSNEGMSIVNKKNYKLNFMKTKDNYIICHAQKEN
jgi:4'-phosphopantetheinyl transferase